MARLGVLTELLQEIYPQNHEEILQELKKIFPKGVKKQKDDDWYKRMNLYVTYPDSFCEDGKCDFEALTKNIPHIKNLGCNAIHVLPFLESPMIDMGFDVSDYLKARDDLGGNDAFDNFLKTANKNDITVFIDLVLNHCSFKHEWFQKAQKGDEYYRDFFVWSKEKPKFIKRFKNEKGIFATYDINGKEVDIYVVFPEQAGEIPHWIEGEDGYWYYHTFYPHQLDINWDNPEVFLTFAKIIQYWAMKGVSFRLDAIQFIGRDLDNGIWLEIRKTHKFIQAMHAVVEQINPDTVFLNEVITEIPVTKQYFGTKDIVESELGYNFPLMKAMWVSMLTKDTTNIKYIVKETYEDLLPWAGWVSFIRNHDELSLEAVDPKIRELIYKNLEPKGLPFRAGFGLGGRTASLLDENVERITMFHFLLASMPGSPAIIYGDEIGKTNDHEYMKKQTKYKRDFLGDDTVQDDTRDINRGIINPEDKATPIATKIYSQLSDIFNTRLAYSQFFTNQPEIIESKGSLITLKYAHEGKTLVCIINIGEESLEVTIGNDQTTILEINNPKLNGSKCTLGSYAGIWLIHSN